MGAMFGGQGNDDALRAQEKAKAKQEQLAAELASRRRTTTSQSKTIFSAVEGTGQSIAKKSKLGE